MPPETLDERKFAGAAAIAGGQYGLIRTAELREIGLTHAAITRWVRAGKLHRRSHGVYTLGHDALPREGEFLAAVFAGGEGAALGHDACVELFGLRRGRAPIIDVIVPKWRAAQPGVRFHESRRIESSDVMVYKGIPVTTIPRLLIDLAATKDDGELANLIHEAAFRGWFDERLVRERMERAAGRTLAPLVSALELRRQGSAGTKSRAEKAMRRRLREQGVQAVPNVVVEGFEVDLHVPGSNVIVEVDGSHHSRPRTREDDALKDRVLAAAGYEVVRVPATRPGGR